MEDPQRAPQSANTDIPIATDGAASTQEHADGSVVRGGGLEQVNLPLDQDTKKLVAAWIAQQGVPTILLFCILGFLAYSMVVLIPEVDKKRSEEIAQRISDLVTRQNEAITKMVESHDKDRELFIELMRDRLPAKSSPSEVR
jgi:hypothetical protein